MKSKRVQIILTESMEEELKKIAEKRGASVSSLARIALAEWLESQGVEDVQHYLAWGGVRK